MGLAWAAASTPGCSGCLRDHRTLMWPASAYLDLPFRCLGQIASSLPRWHLGRQWDKIKSLLGHGDKAQGGHDCPGWTTSSFSLQGLQKGDEVRWFWRTRQNCGVQQGSWAASEKAEGSCRGICYWLLVQSQPRCRRASAENGKAYLKPVVLDTLTWLFEAFGIIVL